MYKYLESHGETARFIALQESLRKKAKDKLPEFSSAGALFTRKGLEQSSSEAVAKYRAGVFRGEKLLSLAAGLGIDDWAFSNSFKLIISVEQDKQLNDIALYNFELLKINNIKRINETVEIYLDTDNSNFDLIYLDPDRRFGEKRQILLSDHTPNIIELMPILLKRTKQILIKCSPMYDHDMALKEIPQISTIYFVSRLGEMKEMLLLVNCHEKTGSKTGFICVDIGKEKTRELSFGSSGSEKVKICREIKGYFLEPGVSIVKARKHDEYAAACGLLKIDSSTTFYCSSIPIDDFFGRCIPIVHSMPFNIKKCKTYFKSLGIKQCHLKARGIKIKSSDALYQLNLKEGGEDYIFLLPFKDKKVLIHCKY